MASEFDLFAKVPIEVWLDVVSRLISSRDRCLIEQICKEWKARVELFGLWKIWYQNTFRLNFKLGKMPQPLLSHNGKDVEAEWERWRLTYKTDVLNFSPHEKSLLNSSNSSHSRGELFHKFSVKTFIGISGRHRPAMTFKFEGALARDQGETFLEIKVLNYSVNSYNYGFYARTFPKRGFRQRDDKILREVHQLPLTENAIKQYSTGFYSLAVDPPTLHDLQESFSIQILRRVEFSVNLQKERAGPPTDFPLFIPCDAFCFAVPAAQELDHIDINDMKRVSDVFSRIYVISTLKNSLDLPISTLSEYLIRNGARLVEIRNDNKARSERSLTYVRAFELTILEIKTLTIVEYLDQSEVRVTSFYQKQTSEAVMRIFNTPEVLAGLEIYISEYPDSEILTKEEWFSKAKNLFLSHLIDFVNESFIRVLTEH